MSSSWLFDRVSRFLCSTGLVDEQVIDAGLLPAVSPSRARSSFFRSRCSRMSMRVSIFLIIRLLCLASLARSSQAL